MRCVCRLVAPSSSDFGVGGVRGHAVARLLGEGPWPSVSGTFDLAGEEVGFFTRSKYDTCDTVFFTVYEFCIGYPLLFCIPLDPTAVAIILLEQYNHWG